MTVKIRFVPAWLTKFMEANQEQSVESALANLTPTDRAMYDGAQYFLIRVLGFFDLMKDFTVVDKPAVVNPTDPGESIAVALGSRFVTNYPNPDIGSVLNALTFNHVTDIGVVEVGFDPNRYQHPGEGVKVTTFDTLLEHRSVRLSVLRDILREIALCTTRKEAFTSHTFYKYMAVLDKETNSQTQQFGQ